MKKTYYPTIKETVYHEKMSNGLNVYLMPKDGFTKTYGLFSTRFGSIDRSFVPLGETDLITVPDGVAHFLEHKMFDMEDGDASEKFAALGASSNAFTSHSRTAYLFNTAANVDECTELLLDFVQELNVTPESIEKEKGIINQEIGMYNDDPDWRGYFGAISNLYHNHPVRIDIAGTIESIAKIDKDLLYRCYNTFYNLNNMVIAVAGNFDVDKTLEICDELLKPSKDHGLQVIVPDEPLTVHEKRNVQKLSCAIPLFNIGWKFPAYSGKEQLEKYIVYNILMELCLGRTSDFYNRMYEDGLLNDAFNVGVFCGRGFFSVIADGESTDPDKVLSEIEKELFRLRKEGLY